MALVQSKQLTWYERKLLRNALDKITRREILVTAMQIVINTAPKEESHVWVTDAVNPPRPPSWGDYFREYFNEKRSMARNDRRLAHERANAEAVKIQEEVKRMQLENRLLEEQVYKETGFQTEKKGQQVRIHPTTGKTLMQR